MLKAVAFCEICDCVVQCRMIHSMRLATMYNNIFDIHMRLCQTLSYDPFYADTQHNNIFDMHTSKLAPSQVVRGKFIGQLLRYVSIAVNLKYQRAILPHVFVCVCMPLQHLDSNVAIFFFARKLSAVLVSEYARFGWWSLADLRAFAKIRSFHSAIPWTNPACSCPSHNSYFVHAVHTQTHTHVRQPVHINILSRNVQKQQLDSLISWHRTKWYWVYYMIVDIKKQHIECIRWKVQLSRLFETNSTGFRRTIGVGHDIRCK